MPLTDDERSSRRTGFVDGPRVRLADGRDWSLPLRGAAGDDPEYDALLAMLAGSEDRPEALRAGLALTIFLLTRNYDLPPDRLDALLRFAPGHPDLAALQRTVFEVAFESSGRVGRCPSTPHATGSAAGRPVGPSRQAPLRTFEVDGDAC